MVGGSEYPREKTGGRGESKTARDLHTPRRPLAVLLCENNVNKSSGAGVLLLLLLFQIFLHDLEDQVGDAAALPFRLTLQPGFELAGYTQTDLCIGFRHEASPFFI